MYHGPFSASSSSGGLSGEHARHEACCSEREAAGRRRAGGGAARSNLELLKGSLTMMQAGAILRLEGRMVRMYRGPCDVLTSSCRRSQELDSRLRFLGGREGGGGRTGEGEGRDYLLILPTVASSILREFSFSDSSEDETSHFHKAQASARLETSSSDGR